MKAWSSFMDKYYPDGDKDSLFKISTGVHNMLEEKKVPHIWNVIPGGAHDFKVWKSELYQFAQLVFKEPGQEMKSTEAAPKNAPEAQGGKGEGQHQDFSALARSRES